MRFFLRQPLFLVFIVLSIALGSANAQNSPSKWEFSGVNQPNYSDLLEVSEAAVTLACGQEFFDELYKNYAIIHPDFSAVMLEPDMRERWRTSLIVRGSATLDSLNICFFEALIERWYQGTNSLPLGEIIFCGIPANDLSIQKIASAKALEELTYYGIQGSASALRFVLAAHPDFRGVKLNDDFHYLAQLVFDSLVEPTGSLRDMANQYLVSSPENNLTPERRQFVLSAFERGEYQSVLDTMVPCET